MLIRVPHFNEASDTLVIIDPNDRTVARVQILVDDPPANQQHAYDFAMPRALLEKLKRQIETELRATPPLAGKP